MTEQKIKFDQYVANQIFADKLSSISVKPNSYSLPITSGTTEKNRLAMDNEFQANYSSVFSNMVNHAIDLGQYPVNTFVGYGVLQQIAQNGMIRACVQTIADEMTREWIRVIGGDKSEDKEKPLDIENALDKKYKIRKVFNEAFSTMGYMGGSFIFIDTGADDNSLPLTISNTSSEFEKGKKINFVVVDPVNVSPKDYNATNPLKSDYMNPTSWWVQGQEVHASRLLKFVDNIPPILLKPSYNFLGIPQAQILWDYVIHWNKSRLSAVNILEKLNLMIFKTDVLQSIQSPEGLENIDLRMQMLNRYRSNDSVFVCDNTDEHIENVSLNLGGATDVCKQALEFVASINRTPAVKLLGISPAGFNATGESDIRNYYDHIKSKQEKFRDNIQKVINIIQLCEYGYIDDSITFEFKELGKEDEQTKLAVESQKIQTLSSLQEHNVISNDEVRQAVKNTSNLGLDFLEEDAPLPIGANAKTEEEKKLEEKIRNALNGENSNGAEGNTIGGSEHGNTIEVSQKVS